MKHLKASLYFLAVLALLSISGCNSFDSAGNLQYKPAPPIDLGNVLQPDSLYLPNVIDKRAKHENISFTPDADPLILIPLWPYSHSSLNPVIRYDYFQPSLIETLNKLFVADLSASGIFKRVINSPKGIKQKKFEEKLFSASPDTYKLEIILKKAVWSRYLTSYGLSYPGTILWALGLPASYGHVYFTVEATLYAPKGKVVIGKEQIHEELPCTEWIYDQVNYRPAISEFKLAAIFPKVTKKLRNFIFQSIKTYQTKNKIINMPAAMKKAENPKL